MKRIGLYIHAPFCAHKCGYCDFNSWAEQSREPQVRYLEALKRQLKVWSSLIPKNTFVDTVFMGGGTPSLLQNDILLSLGTALRDSMPLADEMEWTAECNPETLTDEKIAALIEMGANRLSVGVQSFDAEDLRRLERQAEPKTNLLALERVSKSGLRWSLDLMFALPRQDIKSWARQLEIAMSFSPRHLSAYQLTLTTARSKNWAQAGEDELREFFEFTRQYLRSRGLGQYEISNFCEPGQESRHNLKYWELLPFVGLGPGASGLVAADVASALGVLAPWGLRIKNPDRFEVWESGAGLVVSEKNWSELRTESQHLAEMLMMGLRLNRGIKISRFTRHQEALVAVFEEDPNFAIEGGYLRCRDESLALLDALLPTALRRLESRVLAKGAVGLPVWDSSFTLSDAQLESNKFI